ncbi:CubicO group peptidase (beta-lactamase class C family) [Breoghania corrubedonensis]|uniref:CubicO group peptidase (Beta-lactamase class C family) n=1 Tax=Breoghania corrubedonensis TaxID=665038 RepID=A0A2T5VG35_9HYPH|nr:serine hydrolase domain-containing protein [Breoghania corrubedonensis]PTW62715.1 CubicO group peptidase (beta-lactamase class C family) [Breoghania corrubedonensis]
MNELNWKAAQAAAERAVTSWDGTSPGGAVIGFDGRDIRFQTAAGLASLATRAPFTADTVVRYASVTKHVFASFVLAHPEAISLEDPLARHLPRLQPALGDITVGRALDMSGGVPDTRECLTLIGHSIFTETKAAPLLAFHAAMRRANYPAGTEVHYSNGGYRLVEAAMQGHGLAFDDFVGTEIRDGLGLAMRAMEMWTDPLEGLAPGYWRDGEGWRVGLQGMHLSAAGSLAGSAHALALWAQALLRGEGHFEGRLSALTARRYLADGRPTDYGLGMRRQMVGGAELVGHGGSQPGYKTYFLIDPRTSSGCVIVTNRDDVNTSEIAQTVMAALLNETLPRTGSTLRPGLYVGETGGDWMEVADTSAARLDDEVALYPAGEGWVDSLSPTSHLRLRMDGEAIVGEAGHSPVRYQPVFPVREMPSDLEGEWRAPDFSACLTIRGGAVEMGAGPTRQQMPLRPLGDGRCLFTLRDGPWSRRICLNTLAPDRIELALSRARMIEYVRAS